MSLAAFKARFVAFMITLTGSSHFPSSGLMPAALVSFRNWSRVAFPVWRHGNALRRASSCVPVLTHDAGSTTYKPLPSPLRGMGMAN